MNRALYPIPALALDGDPVVYVSDRAPWTDVWGDARFWVLFDIHEDGSDRTYVLGHGPTVPAALRAAADAWEGAEVASSPPHLRWGPAPSGTH